MYRNSSPAPSSTSLSDNDDDDVNKSTFFPAADSLVLSPAQWSSRLHMISPAQESTLYSPMSNLPPEVLIHILRHLHSVRDLHSCLLVSRTWCECSVELLWHKPTFSSLSTLVKMMRILSRGDQTFTYARFIRRLNFLYLGVDLSDALFARLAQCDRLERLTLVNCALISDEALSRVLPFCPNLVAIDLTGVIDASDRAIVGLASVARRLQGINLGGCKKVTDKGILALAANCPLLRRVKLSGVELVTDDPISALAKSCPLLLEIDLNHCRRITHASVRDIWAHSTHMREMRLSHCEALTDSAFPAPIKTRADTTTAPAVQNVFPPSHSLQTDEQPPLVLSRPFDQLRMLDLTGCGLITDDAIDGIMSYSPKIRNLVLSKCGLLTDRAVENICRLGKHLHYLHLGHAALITDRSVRVLARCCTRLRYVDFANCTLLTDMAVFELASLPKLRRIGLVRVSNLTDEAIYSLANREATLERIHLSYCDQITSRAIHFLLLRLHKLTHLSLTGIPAFRKPELQQFCRPPPSEFNLSQRAAFCVYSGKGVSELRTFLTILYKDEMNTGDDSTEYDDEDGYVEEDPADVDVETGNEGDDEDYVHVATTPAPSFPAQPNMNVFRGRRQTVTAANGGPHVPLVQDVTFLRDQRVHTIPPPAQDRTATLPPGSPMRIHGHTDNTRTSSRRTNRIGGFGHQPLVELSNSPTPSDVASNRSTGTNQSNGAGFFRTYQDVAAASSARSTGAQTPDLDFAEIGHGRGTGHRHTDSLNGIAGPSSSIVYASTPHLGLPSGHHTAGRAEVLADSSNSYRPITWPHMHRETSTPPPSGSSSRDLHDSVQSALGDSYGQNRDVEGRGRSVKRSLRNTFQAAENLASSLLFGRQSGSNAGLHDMGGGSGSAADSHGRH